MAPKTKILSVEPSTRKDKRYMAKMKDGQIIHFGDPEGETYLDHGDKDKRYNYHRRHLANPLERELITQFKLSPALLSYYLLWGYYTDMKENIDEMNRRWADPAGYLKYKKEK